MLEILVLLALTSRIGKMVEQKGHKSGGYKVLTVVLWIGGEIVGAILGTLMTGADKSAQCAVYIVALMGAAAGAVIAYLIANNLSPALPASLPVSPTAGQDGLPSAQAQPAAPTTQDPAR